ncbi:Rhodanese-related sulfurtransferase [Cohaesibacter sp. ES.047]|uniref:rhodanese-like domain-containing protein n=1 Tax=Cohaesibacter sp. ES.047 TaxID=1798205 RepID=UPI000BB7363E|nr:rhodanese-like domain-containing protein [Cohaesibacter sp. ES.047]SNY93934.1 Rhodanese-related sulfurtransferase [Cohaesibacter sp. ES.047]
MAQSINVTYEQLIAEAEAEIETISVEQAKALLNDDGYVFVDIRDIRELDRQGRVPGAVHAPRGMLEFWVCPTSPYHRDVFAQDKTFIFFCAAGWRSALATQQVQRMGMSPVAHIAGGFTAWKEGGGAVETSTETDRD